MIGVKKTLPDETQDKPEMKHKNLIGLGLLGEQGGT
jgi:hypothetical protein